MTVQNVKDLLSAKLLCEGCGLDSELHAACGSDLMSDVLAYVKDQGVLLTGLINSQVVRTAEMMDITCIVFVRGKTPDGDMVELARQRNLAVMCTEHTMYTACGILYENGLRGGDYRNE